MTPLLGIYPKEVTHTHEKATSIPIFITAECTIADMETTQMTIHCIKKLWYIYSVEYYSTTKKNEVLLFASKRSQLETIMLNQTNESQKDK